MFQRIADSLPQKLASKWTTRASKRTPKAPIAARFIVAIDLGKVKNVSCALDPKSGECQYHTFPTNRDELRDLLERFEPDVTSLATPSDSCPRQGLPKFL